MSRPMNPIAQSAVDAYRVAREIGCSETDAWAAARSAAGAAWTPSIKTVVSRHLQHTGQKTQDQRGGNQRHSLTKAVWARLRQGQAALHSARAKAADELAIGVREILVKGRVEMRAQWMDLLPEARQRAADAERLLAAGRGWAVIDRVRRSDGSNKYDTYLVVRGNHHELDCAVIAPVAVAAENRRQVAQYWEDRLNIIRDHIMHEIRLIVAKYPEAPQDLKDSLVERAEAALWGSSPRTTSTPVVAGGLRDSTALLIEHDEHGGTRTILKARHTSSRITVQEVDLFADDDESLNVEECSVPARPSGHHGSRSSNHNRQAWAAARTHQ